ncbi:YkuS family protein [Caloranaerobacter sp. DY30410]|uniref:YkuS family protein n=1 Tax=Caloranaerobacter sp. DY30410 TaxID=3238305 RepID=UPI003D003ED5
MKKRIVVEDGLKNMRDFLSSRGYYVESLSRSKNNLDNCDAIIVSGQDSNFMGIHDSMTKKPVIDAAGKSPQDVYNQLKGLLK